MSINNNIFNFGSELGLYKLKIIQRAYIKGHVWTTKGLLTVPENTLTFFEKNGVKYVQSFFESSGYFMVNSPVSSVKFALVGGGGTGARQEGNQGSGGGGAGGVILWEGVLEAGYYGVTLGAGGSGESVPNNSPGANGSNSELFVQLNTGEVFKHEAIGGGAGGGSNRGNGFDGGSGGGGLGTAEQTVGGAGLQGSMGGNGSGRTSNAVFRSGGGGGGYSTKGGDGTYLGADETSDGYGIGGNGGNGVLLDFAEHPFYVAGGGGGGGGGRSTNIDGLGGIGGGTDAARSTSVPNYVQDATNGSGSGGSQNGRPMGNGGDGLFIMTIPADRVIVGTL